MKKSFIFNFIFLFATILAVNPALHAETAAETPLKNETIRRLPPDEPPLPPSLRDYEIKEAPKGERFYTELVNMLFTLGIIVLLLVGLSWILKRMMNTRLQQVNEASTIKIVEHRSITPKTSIFVLDVRGKGIAIAESTNGVIRLSDVDLDEEEAKPPKKFEMPSKE